MRAYHAGPWILASPKTLKALNTVRTDTPLTSLPRTRSSFASLAWWKGLRPLNLGLLVFTQLYLIGSLKGIDSAMYHYPDIVAIVLSTMTMAASGYLLNDLYDFTTDRFNRPGKVWFEESEPLHRIKAIALGLGLMAMALAWSINPWYVGLYAGVGLLLWCYALWIKSWVLVGNLLVAALMGLATALPGLVLHKDADAILPWYLYGGFAFGIGLLRELIKDIEDVKGDVLAGRKTFPILFGVKRATHLALVLALAFGFVMLSLAVLHFDPQTQTWPLWPIVVGFWVLAFTLYTIPELMRDAPRWKSLSSRLKWLMLFGILTAAVFT